MRSNKEAANVDGLQEPGPMAGYAHSRDRQLRTMQSQQISQSVRDFSGIEVLVSQDAIFHWGHWGLYKLVVDRLVQLIVEVGFGSPVNRAPVFAQTGFCTSTAHY